MFYFEEHMKYVLKHDLVRFAELYSVNGEIPQHLINS